MEVEYNVLDLLKLGSDDERREKIKSLPQTKLSHLPLTRGFGISIRKRIINNPLGSNAYQITEPYVFVKTLAVDEEDGESRVDILVSRDTGKIMV